MLVTARCIGSDPLRTLQHEQLFNRPQTKDSPRCRRWHVQGSGGPHLLCEPLVDKALREESFSRRIASSEEASWICPEAGPNGHKTPGGRSQGAALCQPSGSLHLHRDRNRIVGEPLDDVPLHSPPWSEQEKRGRVATERDEFRRTAWRVMVAAAVNPESLVFVDEMGVHTSLAPIYGYAKRGERLNLEVPRNRGKNTTLLSSMTVGGMGVHLWPWKGRPQQGSSRPM